MQLRAAGVYVDYPKDASWKSGLVDDAMPSSPPDCTSGKRITSRWCNLVQHGRMYLMYKYA